MEKNNHHSSSSEAHKGSGCCHDHEHHHHAHKPKEPTIITEDTIFLCPMHPEIRQSKPGSCPICGMALEPETPQAVGTDNPELIDMQRRFWIGGLLTLPLLALEMFGHIGLNHILPTAIEIWVQMILATPVVLWAGWPFFVRGWQSILNKSLNMFTLIAMGTGAAYLYSVIALLFPSVFPHAAHNESGYVDVYFESAAVIVVLVLLGQVLELRAREKTGDAIRALLDLTPKMARRLSKDGKEEEIQLALVQKEDRLRIRPGEQIPVDGKVIEGKSAVDESAMTGESIPVEKHRGDSLLAGTTNGTGALIMQAERIGKEMVLSQIIQMVAEAQRSRAPIQRLADHVAAWFVPAVIFVAILALGLWYFFGPEPAFAHGLIAATAVLIIACPCALGLATPMSIMVGIGKGAGQGILIKNAEALEVFEKIDILVFDKTGTLTAGKPIVTKIIAPDQNEDEMLRLASAVEISSEHPLAQAILKHAQARDLTIKPAMDFKSYSGKGASSIIEGKQIAIGNKALMQELKIDSSTLEQQAEEIRKDGATVMYMALDQKCVGLIAIADPIKESTEAALRDLREEGIRLIMLTGDSKTNAEAIARKLGITEVIAGVLPQDKGRIIRELKAEGRKVAMAGDGINDAPALAEADIGIAMGTGTDVAIQSAGVTLLKGDLAGIAKARHLSRATMRNIRENLFLAFIYNSLGVPIAAGLLYPLTGLLLSPIIAAAAMSLSSVSVIGNALRLRVTKL